MDISGVQMPAVPEVSQEPPHEAQAQRAVQEASQSEPQNNDAQADSGSRRDPSSNLGQNVDEHA